MIWKIIIGIVLLIIGLIGIAFIIGFKDFFSYMVGDDDADYYKEELAAMEREAEQ